MNSFNQLLSSRNQESLEREGGVCIVYTHFADGFVKDGKVNPKTEELLTELSRRNGWFVPVFDAFGPPAVQTDQGDPVLSREDEHGAQVVFFKIDSQDFINGWTHETRNYIGYGSTGVG